MIYKILTIEDDQMVAEDLKNKLSALGHVVIANASTAHEAIEQAICHSPDIIIADIHIQGEKDGISAVSWILQFHKCPIIYLSAESDSAAVKRAVATHPVAFLIKPFKLSEFSINIDLALKKIRQSATTEDSNFRLHDSIFLPENFLHFRVQKKDIVFVEADGSYVRVCGKDKYYTVSVNLKNFERQLDDKAFIRVSRKHLINSRFVSRINGNTLYLKLHDMKEHMITMSQELRQQIFEKFIIVRTKQS